MRIIRVLVAFAVMVFALAPVALAQGVTTAADKAIRAVMEKQTADWNRGDLDAFVTGYKNSPDILFIGATVNRGYAAMVARYKANYGTQEKMGMLSFSGVEVQPLDARFATLTGRFHLERTAAGGGNADGSYLLVLEKTAAGWKIVRDVTMPSAKPAN